MSATPDLIDVGDETGTEPEPTPAPEPEPEVPTTDEPTTDEPSPPVEAVVHRDVSGQWAVDITIRHPDQTIVHLNGRTLWSGQA